MSLAGDRAEQNLYIVRSIMERDDSSFAAALEMAAGLISPEERTDVEKLWQQHNPTPIRVLRPVELSATGGPRPWFDAHDTSRGYYWRRQRSFLVNRLHRLPRDIDGLDLSSDRVLSHLEDPRSGAPFLVKGLVVGHVQSGKTANFSALIAKAADAGYKIVIVLSGLHNSLRQQTQRRLQRDLGHEDYTDGVGQGSDGPWWQWMTSDETTGDFNPNSASAAMLQGSNQVILVVKKNKSRLDRLIRWMDKKVPDRVPVLVVDDEADQASVNTGGNRERPPIAELTDLTADDYEGGVPADDELDPSAINKRIRQLINGFARCSYVGYTATPFANLLINPDGMDHEVGRDLFPDHFVISLPPPAGEMYVGAETLFGSDDDQDEDSSDGLDVVRIVPDGEIELVAPPRGTAAAAIVSPSLRHALLDYLLASAARLARSERDQACTMLVHTDQRTAVQNALASAVEHELGSFRQKWRYDRPTIAPELIGRWDDFRRVTAQINLDLDKTFDEITPYLDQLLGPGIPVIRLNSNHEVELDFDAQPTLKAVIVGGNKLARGVTVEGLLTSFYVRRSIYYDTLMQMGRWFGYRGDYVDLTRLYSTELLIEWFHDLAVIEADLRRNLNQYSSRRLTPLQIQPRIRSHDVMLPTSKNKLKDSITIVEAFDGRKLQTLRFRFDREEPSEDFARNLNTGRELIESLGAPQSVDRSRIGWSDVPAQPVLTFIKAFVSHPQAGLDPVAIAKYIEEQTSRGELVSWHVLIAGSRRANAELGVVDLHVQSIAGVAMISRSRKRKDPTSLGVVTSPDDEKFGLTEAQVRTAKERYEDGAFERLDDALRAERDAREGLLVLYPISPRSKPRANASDRITLFSSDNQPECVLAYAISLPLSKTAEAKSYITGPTSSRR
jgi:Z1 domain-containing protein